MATTRPRPVLLVLAVAVGLVAAACGGTQAGSTADHATGAAAGGNATEAALGFTAPRLGGGEFAVSSLVGKDAVLWFWAPWCTVCRSEAAGVVAAARALDGQVEVIGVAGRGDLAEMEAFVVETDTGSLSHLADESGTMWSAFGVHAQPSFAFVNDDGSVETFVGALGEAALIERMRTLAAT